MRDDGLDGDMARAPTPSPRDESSMTDPTPRRRNPPTLHLPFEHRLRESHLMSDEEFEAIARQAREDGLLNFPPLSNLRRSISTTRKSRWSTFTPRTRPASFAAPDKYADDNIEPAERLRMALESWQSELARQNQAGSSAPSKSTATGRMQREPPSFTALPRPPTKNDFAGLSSLHLHMCHY